MQKAQKQLNAPLVKKVFSFPTIGWNNMSFDIIKRYITYELKLVLCTKFPTIQTLKELYKTGKFKLNLI